jgi:hypothetical protein
MEAYAANHGCGEQQDEPGALPMKRSKETDADDGGEVVKPYDWVRKARQKTLRKGFRHRPARGVVRKCWRRKGRRCNNGCYS